MPTHMYERRRSLLKMLLKKRRKSVLQKGLSDQEVENEITIQIKILSLIWVNRVMSTTTNTINVLTTEANRPETYDRPDSNLHTIVQNTIYQVVSLDQSMRDLHRAHECSTSCLQSLEQEWWKWIYHERTLLRILWSLRKTLGILTQHHHSLSQAWYLKKMLVHD